MEELNINTVAGNLELAPATVDELKTVAAQWPMGVVFRQTETEPNGLIFQVGEQEAFAPMIAGAVPGLPNAPHAWLDRVKILSQRLRGTNLEQT